jgi:hypothetical protein
VCLLDIICSYTEELDELWIGKNCDTKLKQKGISVSFRRHSVGIFAVSGGF